MSFSWSFSKLQSSETCPRRYNEVDRLKHYKDEDRTALDWGDEVHKAFAQAFLNDTPPPSTMTPWQHWIDEIKELPGQIIIEAKWALDRQFNKCPWSAPIAWYRGKADLTRIDGPIADGVDWKTGRIKEDDTQLLLMALLVFAHFPKVKRCRQRFVWLKEDCATERTFNRRDISTEWLGILQRVKTLEDMEAAAQPIEPPNADGIYKLDPAFVPKPGRLCREWCPVTGCEFHGKSFH